jgi:hypothetical protein
MNCEQHRTCPVIEMKTLLHDMVDWLEECYFRQGPSGSVFEEHIEPVLVVKAQVAFQWAAACDQPVELFTTTIDPKPLLAAVVLWQCRIPLESVYAGDLDDDAFERLTRCVSRISRCKLRIVQAFPPPTVARGAFFGGPLFAVFA